MSAFVLGFSDEAAQIAGLAWSLGGHRGVLVSREGDRSDPGGDASLEDGTVRAAGVIAEAELTVSMEVGAEHALDGDPTPSGSPRVSSGKAAVDAGGKRASCRAHLTRWEEDPSGRAALVRHLALPVSGGGEIVVIATRPEGAADHAREAVTGWTVDPRRGATAFGETLLSTQYGEDGVPVRAGLELWPEDPDAHVQRAAGDRPVTIGDGHGVAAALLHTSADGATGIGGYVLVRM